MTIWVVSLLMSFGRTTFGSLYDIVPGSSDVFIRRFQMGVQLSGILLAGIGLVVPGPGGARRRCASCSRGATGLGVAPMGRGLVAGLCIVVLVVVLFPAWKSMDTYDAHNATNIGLQAEADEQLDPQIDELLAYVACHPQGRVYAGQPTNWGNDFTVGAVPVFKYLESKDIDEVGYTLRTASLMTDPEYYFDDTNPGDYPLFGIGYIITPADMTPPVAGRQGAAARAPTACGRSPTPGYIHVYDTTGVLTATRADVGTQSTRCSTHPAQQAARPDGRLQRRRRRRRPPRRTRRAAGSPGHVVAQHADLENGTARAVVQTNRRATVVLSASYDPGWHATVDGHPAPTVMVAPALVGVDVGPGRAHGGLQLRRLRLLHGPVRAGAGRLRGPRRCTAGVARWAPAGVRREGGRASTAGTAAERRSHEGSTKGGMPWTTLSSSPEPRRRAVDAGAPTEPADIVVRVPPRPRRASTSTPHSTSSPTTSSTPT